MQSHVATYTSVLFKLRSHNSCHSDDCYDNASDDNNSYWYYPNQNILHSAAYSTDSVWLSCMYNDSVNHLMSQLQSWENCTYTMTFCRAHHTNNNC